MNPFDPRAAAIIFSIRDRIHIFSSCLAEHVAEFERNFN